MDKFLLLRENRGNSRPNFRHDEQQPGVHASWSQASAVGLAVTNKRVGEGWPTSFVAITITGQLVRYDHELDTTITDFEGAQASIDHEQVEGNQGECNCRLEQRATVVPAAPASHGL